MPPSLEKWIVLGGMGLRQHARGIHASKAPSSHRRINFAAVANSPAAGSVITQERTISITFFHFTEAGSFLRPAPMIAPVETCVVETGRPFHEARQTSVA